MNPQPLRTKAARAAEVKRRLLEQFPDGRPSIGDARRIADEVEQEAKDAPKLRKRLAKELDSRSARAPKPPKPPKPPEPEPPPPVPSPAAEEPYEPPCFRFDPTGDPRQELAARELCRRRLLPFVQRFRPKYIAGWVHADICRRIERFVGQVEKGESPRLLLMMPPRSGKSELLSRHTPAWILGKHPDWEIIAASHTASLSLSFSRYLRDLIRDPGYTAVFPDTKLDPSSQSLENWNMTKGGGYLAAGRGSGITGRGAHVLVLDDLCKDMEEASSATVRENTMDWYYSTAYTRLAPGGGVLGLMTWWHEDDWAGQIQHYSESGDGDKFEIVKYPAINEQGDEYILPDDRIVQIAPPAPDALSRPAIPEGARLTRKMGTAIHPERYTPEMMRAIQRNLIGTNQKNVWDALYQQNPLPDEGIEFTREMFRYYGSPPRREDLFVYQAWDFAISEGKEADYTVGACIGQDGWDNLYLLDLRRFKMQDGGYIVDEILDFAELWKVDLLGFEDGQIWKSVEFQFKKRCDELRRYPAHELLKPLTDKKARASPLKGRMQLGKLYFNKNAPFFGDLQREFLTFPQGKHDDVIDACAWAVRLTLARSAPRVPDHAPKPKKSWRDLLKATQRAELSHMAA